MKAIDEPKSSEQIRLAHTQVLKTHLLLEKKYRNFITEKTEEVKRQFFLVDIYFYDERGRLNWNSIRMLLPPNLEKNIQKECVLLNENEIKICCLLLFDVSENEIAEIMQLSEETVNLIKLDITNKTGMNDIKDNIKDMLVFS